jgi:hypothetical protein
MRERENAAKMTQGLKGAFPHSRQTAKSQKHQGVQLLSVGTQHCTRAMHDVNSYATNVAIHKKAAGPHTTTQSCTVLSVGLNNKWTHVVLQQECPRQPAVININGRTTES